MFFVASLAKVAPTPESALPNGLVKVTHVSEGRPGVEAVVEFIFFCLPLA